jgi:hypothetical protein
MTGFLAVITVKTFTLLELSSNISSWSSEVCTLKGKIPHLKLDVNRLVCIVSDVRCGVMAAQLSLGQEARARSSPSPRRASFF